MHSRSSSTLAIILANLVPLFGVLFLKWTVLSVVLLFWLESAIIGFFNILKMVFAYNTSDFSPTFYKNGSNNSLANNIMAKVFLIPFFTIHYGGFILGQGLFIFIMLGNQNFLADNKEKLTFLVRDYSFYIALICLFINHLYNFIANYLINKEYQKAVLMNLMFAPYKRIFIQQFVIIGGAFLLISFKTNLVFLVLLISLKIIADLGGSAFENLKPKNPSYN